MRNRLTLSILATFLMCTPVFAQTGTNIKVTVEGFDGEEAYLAYYYADKQYISDTTTAENGTFTFIREEPLDGGIYLVVLPPANNYFEIIIDQDQEFSIETDTADLVGNLTVKGSEDNRLFYEDIQYLASKRKEMESLNATLTDAPEGSPQREEIQAQIAALNEEVTSQRASLVSDHPDMLYSKIISSMQEPTIPDEVNEQGQEAAFFYYRKAFIDAVDFQDTRLLRTPVMWNKVTTYLDKLTYQVPDSINKSADLMISRSKGNDEVFQYLVINILNKYAQSKIMGMDAVYVHLVEEYYMKGQAFWADEEQVNKMAERALAISPTIIGRKAPNFRVQDIGGNWHHLHGVPGKYTILYFWDYDCGHCKTVTPKLAEIYPDYIDHDVSLFALSINGDTEVWKEKVEEYGLTPGINVQDHQRQSGFDAMYDIRSTPRIFILDEEKNIIAKQISVDQVREILDHELGLETEPETDTESEEEGE